MARTLLAFLAFFCLHLSLAQQAEVAALRIVHLSPDAPQFDLLVNGVLSLRDQSFTSVSRYLFLAPGRHELSLFPHRAPAEGQAETEAEGDSVTPLEPLSISVDLLAGEYYTVVASGFFDPPADAQTSGTLDIQMEPGVAAQVRGPRNYLVSLTQPTPLINLTPGTYTVTASREGFRTAEYEVEVTPGASVTLPINLQEGAGDAPVTPSAAGLEVRERPWYKTQLQLYRDDYASFPPAGQAYLRLVHAAPASPALSAFALLPGEGDEEGERLELTANLAFPNASEYLPVPVDTEGLELDVAGSDLVLSELHGLSLESGTFYTIYLSGSVSSDALTPIPYVDAVVRGTLP